VGHPREITASARRREQNWRFGAPTRWQVARSARQGAASMRSELSPTVGRATMSKRATPAMRWRMVAAAFVIAQKICFGEPVAGKYRQLPENLQRRRRRVPRRRQTEETMRKTTRRDTLKLISAGAIVGISPGLWSTSAFAEGKRIAMVVKNLGNSYFDACAKGAREAAAEVGGFEIIYTAPTKATAEEQIAVIDALIAQKVDGIIVSANDANALVPVGKKAMERGIKVISFDSAIAKDGRIMHLNASSTPLIGAKQVQMIAKTLGNKGEVAILSAASTMTNQNSWIAAMKEEWKKPEYKDMPLVATVYGDDQDDKSYREMQALAKAHPNLKGVISPTTIGIRAGAKAIMDDGLVGKIFITGLGLPSEMKDAVLKGACDSFAIWNPVDYGYSSTEVLINILKGAPAGPGSTLKMGRKGDTKVGDDGEAAMGEPFVFDKSNVEEYAKIF
jgi:rhamnose transport system substrate-binding protein